MNPRFEIELLSNDGTLHLRVFGSNGEFSGATQCYVHPAHLAEFAQELRQFPVKDKLRFSSSEQEQSKFAVSFNRVNSTGLLIVAIEIRKMDSPINSPTQDYQVAFDLFVEQHELDAFVVSLQQTLQNEASTKAATLIGKATEFA